MTRTLGGKTLLPVVSSLPASGTLGQPVILSSDGKMYIWNGTGWVNYGSQFSFGMPVELYIPAFDTTYFNDQGPCFLSVKCGVVSQPGQNGHIYLEVNNNAPNVWIPIDYVACRNNQAVGTGGTAPVGGGTANIGAGQGVKGFIPAGVFWRLRTYTASGYSTPSFVSDSSPAKWTLFSGAAPLNKVFRTPHTFAIQGAVVVSTVPAMSVSLASGESQSLVKARYSTGAGTVTFKIQKNGADITGFGTTASPLSASTTDATATGAIALAEDDELTVVILSSTSGSDLRVSLQVEHTTA